MIPESGRSPGEGNGNPLQYSGLENPHGQRCLVVSSPWGHKVSDMTEQLSTLAYLHNFPINLKLLKIYLKKIKRSTVEVVLVIEENDGELCS